MLTGEVAKRVRKLVRETGQAFEIRIVKGVVSKDHVHILVSCPPTLASSEIMRRIKGRTLSKLFEEYPHIKKRYWGRHFWVRGYIYSSPAKECFVLQSFTHDVWPIWDACDIVVIPSTDPEPFGMVALEAMASSKPIVAADHGGLFEIVVHGGIGLLVSPGDALALAKAIRKLSTDSALRLEMGKAGLLRYQREFTLDRYVANISSVYASL